MGRLLICYVNYIVIIHSFIITRGIKTPTQKKQYRETAVTGRGWPDLFPPKVAAEWVCFVCGRTRIQILAGDRQSQLRFWRLLNMEFANSVPLLWPKHTLTNNTFVVGFEVLTAVVMKSTIFWDIMPCSPLKANRHFRRTYRLHFQGRSISRTRYQHEIMWQAEPCFHAGILLGLYFYPENGGNMFFRNVCWLSTDYTTLCLRRWYSSISVFCFFL
jgi:hypothetical protein